MCGKGKQNVKKENNFMGQKEDNFNEKRRRYYRNRKVDIKENGLMCNGEDNCMKKRRKWSRENKR